MDPWVVVVAVGFALATGLVVAMARRSTARWELERASERRRRIARSLHRHRGSAAAGTSVPHSAAPTPRGRTRVPHGRHRSRDPRVSRGS